MTSLVMPCFPIFPLENGTLLSIPPLIAIKICYFGFVARSFQCFHLELAMSNGLKVFICIYPITLSNGAHSDAEFRDRDLCVKFDWQRPWMGGQLSARLKMLA